MNARLRSRSEISFKELKNKTEDIYEFGNDWGLYVDIEMNYQNTFKPQKINRTNYSLFKIFEMDEDTQEKDEENYEENEKINEKDNKANYFNSTKLFLTKLAFYLCIVLGFNYYLDKNNA